MEKTSRKIFITECPRDAIQGIHHFIPTNTKVEFIKKLCKVGFNVLDMGSFVSPKAIPQLSDTSQVLNLLTKKDKGENTFLVIVANERGAEDACNHELVDILGFPFSISNTFQLSNTNSNQEESLKRIENIINIAQKKGKKTRIYLSMAFGNPYQEKWDIELLISWATKLKDIGVDEFALSDTIGVADEKIISEVFSSIQNEFPKQLLSAHFHSNPIHSKHKIIAAFNAGCNSFDVAINGMGGCPLATDELTGNIATQELINSLESKVGINLNKTELEKSIQFATQLYSQYQ